MEIMVDGRRENVDVTDDAPLLWVLRDVLNLTGNKFGCGKALCGACTVHVNGEPVRTCVTPIAAVLGKDITTIEGLSRDGNHRVQQAWIDHDVPQCGFCQPGMITAAATLLERYPQPTDAQIDAAVTNLCRCATYHRMRAAIHAAANARRPA